MLMLIGPNSSMNRSSNAEYSHRCIIAKKFNLWNGTYGMEPMEWNLSNGTYRWNLSMDPIDGTYRWNLSMVHCSHFYTKNGTYARRLFYLH